jgi:benzoyl-CoA reductase subunit D
MTTAIGIDVGSGVIKTALFRVTGDKNEWLARWDARIRQRDAHALVEESIESVLQQAGLTRKIADTWPGRLSSRTDG